MCSHLNTCDCVRSEVDDFIRLVVFVWSPAGKTGLIPDLHHKSITSSLALGSARLPGASEAWTFLFAKEGLTASRSNHSSVRGADKCSVNHFMRDSLADVLYGLSNLGCVMWENSSKCGALRWDVCQRLYSLKSRLCPKAVKEKWEAALGTSGLPLLFFFFLF